MPRVTVVLPAYFSHATLSESLAEATGDILVCTDPDCRPDPAWLRELVTEVQAGRAVVDGVMDIYREAADPGARWFLALLWAKAE